MNLLLQCTVLSLLCLHAQGWVLQRSTPNNPWKSLELLENREMFLTALQSYFHSKGTHVDRTAPAFVLTLKDHDMGFRGTKEGQALVNLEDRRHEQTGQESSLIAPALYQQPQQQQRSYRCLSLCGNLWEDQGTLARCTKALQRCEEAGKKTLLPNSIKQEQITCVELA